MQTKPFRPDSNLKNINSEVANEFPVTIPFSEIIHISTRNALLWDTEKEKAIDKGELIHKILSQIIIRDDITGSLKQHLNEGLISEKQS
ncbi:hypothetical protein, partial [uncultured Planktosalinus sp.]|uniref:hypothetical protein n=1 Tax=uncultured Planktosalinus sp. TaxID=1810935 RepID=UPI0030D76BB5